VRGARLGAGTAITVGVQGWARDGDAGQGTAEDDLAVDPDRLGGVDSRILLSVLEVGCECLELALIHVHGGHLHTTEQP